MSACVRFLSDMRKSILSLNCEAVWDDLRVRDAGWICWEMAVFYWVENQAGERVGVENHPGSDYSGRQCRPHKGVVGGCDMETWLWVEVEDRGMCCGLDKGKCGL